MKQASFGKALTVGIMMIALTIPMLSQASSNASDYYELVRELKSNGRDIDFKALRLAYTKTKDYQPYGSDQSAKDAAHAAFKEKNFLEVLRQAEIVLEKNYVDLDAHLLCMIANREMRNQEKATFHNAILKGLVGSIYSSGDGKSPEKAFVVISIAEEYFFMNANKLKKIKSSSMSINSHHYDKMEVENIRTNEKSAIYFNIDIPYGWLAQNLKKKQ